MTDVSWPDRQHALHDKLAAIKAREAANVIAGRDFDLDELISAEAELELLRVAEGEDRRRHFEEEARLIASRRAALKDEVKALIAERAEAIDAAEAAAKTLAEALKTLFATNARICAALARVGVKQPLWIQGSQARMSASFRLCAALVPITGQRFSAITMKSVGNLLPDGSRLSETWREADARQCNFKATLKEI